MPFATKTVKQIASSDIVKDTTKQLAKRGTEAAADMVADLIQGKDPTSKAKENLNEAKNEIADVIRERAGSKRGIVSKTAKKVKRRKVALKTIPNKKGGNYNLFTDHEAE